MKERKKKRRGDMEKCVEGERICQKNDPIKGQEKKTKIK